MGVACVFRFFVAAIMQETGRLDKAREGASSAEEGEKGTWGGGSRGRVWHGRCTVFSTFARNLACETKIHG